MQSDPATKERARPHPRAPTFLPFLLWALMAIPPHEHGSCPWLRLLAWEAECYKRKTKGPSHVTHK